MTNSNPKMLTEADRERLRKIFSVVRSATIEGEKKAATAAAQRLASSYGLSMEDAELEAFPEEDAGRLSYDEYQAQKKDKQAWAASMVRMTDHYEQTEKYRFMAAKEAAKQRGLEEEEAAKAKKPQKKRAAAQKSGRTYIPNKKDEFRLIAGLLRDGASIKRTAKILGVSTNDVARVWLLLRKKDQAA